MNNTRALILSFFLFVSSFVYASFSPSKTWDGLTWDGGEPTAFDNVYIKGLLNISSMTSNQLNCADLIIENGGAIVFDEPNGFVQINGSIIRIDATGPIYNTSQGCYIDIASSLPVTISTSSDNKFNIPDGVYLRISSGTNLITDGNLLIESGGWIDAASISSIIGDVMLNQSGQSSSTAWNLWSSPVDNNLFTNVFGPIPTAYEFPDGGTTTADWELITQSSSTMRSGKGYCINGSTNTSTRTIDGGGSSSTYYHTFNNYWEAGRTQMIYLKSELGKATKFTEMSLNFTQASSYGYRDFDNFKIKLLETTDTYFSSTSFKDITDAKIVFEEIVYNMPMATGWHTWDIDDFEYKGQGNLLVEISWGDNHEYTSTSDKYRLEYTQTELNTICYAYTDYDDGEYITADAKNKKRPNIKFTRESDAEKTFNGTLNNVASYAPTDPGFVLLGNPFASQLDLYDGFSGFFDDNPDLGGTAYFWIDDGSAGQGFTNSDYAYWNASGATRANGVLPEGNVAVGQGFFVDVLTLPTLVDYKLSQCTNIEEEHYLKNANAEPIERIWLNLVGDNGVTNEMLLAFTDLATIGEDRLYDGRKIIVSGNIGIYSFIYDEIYSIQALPKLNQTKRIPLGVVTNKQSNYSINLRDKENLPQGMPIFLEDALNNTYHDLNLSAYDVNLRQDTFNNRFFLHIGLLASQKQSLDMVSIKTYTKDQTLFMEGLNALGKIRLFEVFDLAGRRLEERHYNAEISSLQYSSQTRGVFMVRIHSEKGTKIEKVFI